MYYAPVCSPPVREEEQRGQCYGQLELSPVPDEVRDQCHTHMAQIERDVMQRADHGSPFSANYFHGYNIMMYPYRKQKYSKTINLLIN